MSRTNKVHFTPEQRALRSRVAAYRSWERTVDPSARTAPARRASMARFERQVDPEGVLTTDERARRATAAMKAYFTALALRSSRSRMKDAAARRTAAEARRQTRAAGGEGGE